MTKRFMLGALGWLVVGGGQPLPTNNSVYLLWAADNAAFKFAETYNAWSAGHEHLIINSQDIERWRATRKAWKQLDSAMKMAGF